MRTLPVVVVLASLLACTRGTVPAAGGDTDAPAGSDTDVAGDGDGDGHDDDTDVADDTDATGGDTDDDTGAGHHGGGDTGCDGSGDDTGDVGGASAVAVLPVAPSSSSFMWQGLQTSFVGSDGLACEASVAVALNDQAVCFVDGAGELECAGRVYTQTYGTSFTATGLGDVTQALAIPTGNAEDGNGICAVSAGVPTCLAYWNFSGQLGNGTHDADDTWTPWAAGTGIEHLATGTTDKFCGIDGAGDGWCTGDGVGTTPSVLGSSESTVWIDTFGTVKWDPTDAWRASQVRAACHVTSSGLTCDEEVRGTFGTAGHVVDGGEIETDPFGAYGDDSAVLWLEDDGTVWESLVDRDDHVLATAQRFVDQPVLAIAYDFYSQGACAVYADGSLACVGPNREGRFGTGSTADLSVETTVLPAGTFDLSCTP